MYTLISEKDRAFVRAIRQAVQEKGKDFNYYDNKAIVHCVYFEPDGCPSCLIGYALSIMGYSLNDLQNLKIKKLQLSLDSEVNSSSAKIVLPELGFSHPIVFAATSAQLTQDEKGSWGKALDKFELILKNYEIIVD